MSSTEEKVTITWKIENVSFSAKRPGESIRSPCFKLSSLDKTYWFLKCFPRGVRNKLVLVVKLCRDDEYSGPEKINIGFKAYVMAFDGSSAFERENDSLLIEKGEETKIIGDLRDNFFKTSIISPMDILTICCELWKNCNDSNIAKPSSVIANTSLEQVVYGEDFRTVHKEVSKDLKGISKLQDLNPIKFYAKTQIQVERKTFIHTINDFGSLQSPCYFSFVIHPISDGMPSLVLTMGFIEEFSDVKICITPLLEKVDQSFVVNCKALILASKGSPLSVMNKTRFFESAEELPWKTTFNNCEFLTQNDLYFPYDVLSVRFELDICNGTEISSIEKIVYANPKNVIKKERTLMEDLLNYYKEQKFCDVELRANNEQVLAHKAVLCSRSIFFRNFFKNNEKEIKTSNAVEITNIDVYTLKLMLEFMYLEKIEDFQDQDVLKLYSAATFYGYEKLKKSCSSFLSSNVQSVNVWEILKISHNHGDEELKDSAINHICQHVKEVFSMAEWKQLIFDNILLATEILRHLSSVIQETYKENQSL
ncbi:speckle-type POZ protein [Caerostris darwini]|uniref:Speckle-type POZ protein n=1 Tax=Caerostris darwini TaxID=1538125 RepID=A0AAV4TR62_9ARAC|nr:speckle-type POZ protein [Caerostris darwini]